MKKIFIVALLIFLIYIVIRFLFSYTIFCVPYMFGTKTYVGGAKYDFPICIVNPMKTKNVKRSITYYLEDLEKESNQANTEIYNFFGIQNKSSDFEIISVNTDDKVEDSFLLQKNESSKRKCVVFIDKKTKRLLRFAF